MIDPMTQTFPEVDDVATEAVSLLDIEEFIEKNLDILYEKIEEVDRTVPQNDDVRFAALSEQLVRTVIYFASGRNESRQAIAWVNEQWKNKTENPDPMTILSMLTLMYIVKQGMKQSDPKRQQTWKRFNVRLASVSEPDDAVTVD
jgi:hypothetical protein